MSTINLLEEKKKIYKSRFLGKIGQRLVVVPVNEVAYFQANNKLVYLADITGSKYIVDHTLEQLESILDPQIFFRINRKFIITHHSIHHIRPYVNSRLKVCLKDVSEKEEMIVSRERVNAFMKWVEG